MHYVLGAALSVTIMSAEPARLPALPLALEILRSVGSEAKGNALATNAWKAAAAANADEIPRILGAMKDANPLAQNWIRAAVDSIAERELAAGNLAAAPLADFVRDREQANQARQVAFEWLKRVDAETAEAMIPAMIDDPAVGFRRLAVQQKIDAAQSLTQAGKAQDAIATYRQALDAARDVDQVRDIAKALREANQEVDLPKHFGFLMHWKVIGPFDNSNRAGFDAVYPPEEAQESKVDLNAKHAGKDGEIGWIDFTTEDEYGMVDLNKPLGALKEATAYVYTEFVADQDMDVQLRLGCKNAWKVWLNGELLFGRDEYHRGMRIDQYVMNAPLKKGPNRILVKACQNEQTESWTVEWQFQIRVCDAAGTAVHAAAPPSFLTQTASRKSR